MAKKINIIGAKLRFRIYDWCKDNTEYMKTHTKSEVCAKVSQELSVAFPLTISHMKYFWEALDIEPLKASRGGNRKQSLVARTKTEAIRIMIEAVIELHDRSKKPVLTIDNYNKLVEAFDILGPQPKKEETNNEG